MGSRVGPGRWLVWQRRYWLLRLCGGGGSDVRIATRLRVRCREGDLGDDRGVDKGPTSSHQDRAKLPISVNPTRAYVARAGVLKSLIYSVTTPAMSARTCSTTAAMAGLASPWPRNRGATQTPAPERRTKQPNRRRP